MAGGVGFEPNGMYCLVQVPKEYYEKKGDLIINEATKKSLRNDYLQKGDKLLVAATGSDCKFVQPGDMVSVQTRGAFELTIGDDEESEPFMVIRETEIIGKFD